MIDINKNSEWIYYCGIPLLVHKVIAQSGVDFGLVVRMTEEEVEKLLDSNDQSATL